MKRVESAIADGRGPGDVEFVSAARALAIALGTPRPEVGTFKAIHAVVRRPAYNSDEEACTAVGAKARTFFKCCLLYTSPSPRDS